MGKKIHALILSLFLFPTLPLLGFGNQLYRLDRSPFSADIASRAGDLITIMVDEKTIVNDNGQNNVKKEEKFNFDLTKIFFPHFKLNEGFDDTISSGTSPGLNLETEKEQTANAKRESEHTVSTKFQARVVEVLPGNQLVIRGERLANLSGTEKKVFITGIIRQGDIRDDNSIESHLIADAVMEVDGSLIRKELAPSMLGRVISNLLF